LSVEPGATSAPDDAVARAAELDVIYANAPVGLCFLDAELRFVRVNAAMAAINGRETAAHIGLTVRQVLGPLADQLEPLYRMVLETGEPIAGLELKAAPRPERAQDGPAHWIIHVHPVRDDVGGTLGINVSVSDVTESRRHEDHRRRLYQELLESEERLRALSDNLPYGMVYQIAVAADGARRFTHIGANCERLNGVSAKAALADAQALYSRIDPAYLPELVALEDRALATLDPFDAEAPFLQADGSRRWFHLSAAPRTLHDGSVVWDGIQIDVTERREAEEHRKLLLKELNHRVANSFQLAVSLLQLHANRAADAGVKAQLETVQHRLVAIAAAHANLYDDGQLRTLEAGRYLEELCRRLGEGWTADSQITLDVAAEPCELATERAIPLGLILNELVTNAAKYAFEGRDGGRIEVRFGRTEDGCRLSVADDGNGLPENGMERSGGLGMGLVKALARQIGGVLHVENRAGARFVIDLPD
jgi:PAS domain S-box-containing protein